MELDDISDLLNYDSILKPLNCTLKYGKLSCCIHEVFFYYLYNFLASIKFVELCEKDIEYTGKGYAIKQSVCLN